MRNVLRGVLLTGLAIAVAAAVQWAARTSLAAGHGADPEGAWLYDVPVDSTLYGVYGIYGLYGTIRVSIDTANSSYVQGDTVPIVGSVVGDGGSAPLAGQTVLLQVEDPNGNYSDGSATTGSDGSFTFDYALGASAPIGTYVVNVTALPDLGLTVPADTAALSFMTTASGLPDVTGLSPDGGAASGGTQVVIAGTAFTGATSVDFGAANPAPAVEVVSDTEIVATSPPGCGTVDVAVTNPSGTSSASAADEFTYATACPPTVALYAPTADGLTATVNGTSTDAPSAAEFSWSWGDGSPSETGAFPQTHTYADAGTYTLTVTVTLDGGVMGSAAESVTVASGQGGGTLADGNTAVPDGYYPVNGTYPFLLTDQYECGNAYAGSDVAPASWGAAAGDTACAGTYALLLDGGGSTVVPVASTASDPSGTTYEVNPSPGGSDLGVVPAGAADLTQGDSVSYTIEGDGDIGVLAESDGNDQIGIVISTGCSSGCDQTNATPYLEVDIDGQVYDINVQSYTDITLNGAPEGLSASADGDVAYVATVGGYGQPAAAADPGTGNGNAVAIALYDNQITGVVTAVSTGANANNIAGGNDQEILSFTLRVSGGTSSTLTADANFASSGITLAAGDTVTVLLDSAGEARGLASVTESPQTGTLASADTAIPNGLYPVNGYYPFLLTDQYGCSADYAGGNILPIDWGSPVGATQCTGSYDLLLTGSPPSALPLASIASSDSGTTYAVNPSSDGSDSGIVPSGVAVLTQGDRVSYTLNGSDVVTRLIEENANDQIGVVTATGCASGCDRDSFGSGGTPGLQITIDGRDYDVDVQPYTALTVNGATAAVTAGLDGDVAYASTVGGYGVDDAQANPGTGDTNGTLIALYDNRVTGTVTSVATGSDADNIGGGNPQEVLSFTLDVASGSTETYTVDVNFNANGFTLQYGQNVTVALDSAGDAAYVLSAAGAVMVTVAVSPASLQVGGVAALDGTVTSNGNPVSGASVTFSASAGTVSPSTVTSGSDGTFSATFTAPESPGSATVSASSDGATNQAAVIVTASGAVTPPQSCAGVTVGVGSLTLAPGGTGQLQVTVEDVPSPGLAGYQLALAYDPSVAVAEAVYATAGWSPVANVGEPGVVLLSAANATGSTGTQTLAEIEFQAMGSAGASGAVTVSSLLLADADGATMQGCGVAGTITVASTPSYAAQASATAAVDPADSDQAGLELSIPEIDDAATGQPASGESVAGYQLTLTAADPTAVRFLDVQCPSGFSTCASNVDQDTGQVTITAAGATGVASPVGLGFVALRVIGPVTATETMTLALQQVVDGSGTSLALPQPVTLTLQRGAVYNACVDGAPATGVQPLSVTDAVAALQYLVALREAGTACGDVNVVNLASLLPDTPTGSSTPTVADVVALLQYLVGLRGPDMTLSSGS